MAEEQVDYEAYEEEQPMAEGAGEDVSLFLRGRRLVDKGERKGEGRREKGVHRRLRPSGARARAVVEGACARRRTHADGHADPQGPHAHRPSPLARRRRFAVGVAVGVAAAAKR